MCVQVEDQRLHPEEQVPFLIHEVGLHPKQLYCAAQEGKKINNKIEKKRKKTGVQVLMFCST